MLQSMASAYIYIVIIVIIVSDFAKAIKDNNEYSGWLHNVLAILSLFRL